MADSTLVLVDSQLTKLENYGWGDGVKQMSILTCNNIDSKEQFGINPFYISIGNYSWFRYTFGLVSFNIFFVMFYIAFTALVSK